MAAAGDAAGRPRVAAVSGASRTAAAAVVAAAVGQSRMRRSCQRGTPAEAAGSSRGRATAHGSKQAGHLLASVDRLGHPRRRSLPRTTARTETAMRDWPPRMVAPASARRRTIHAVHGPGDRKRCDPPHPRGPRGEWHSSSSRRARGAKIAPGLATAASHDARRRGVANRSRRGQGSQRTAAWR